MQFWQERIGKKLAFVGLGAGFVLAVVLNHYL